MVSRYDSAKCDHVFEGVKEIKVHSIVGDGVERPVDAIILGTGFEISAPPIAQRVRGVTGKKYG